MTVQAILRGPSAVLVGGQSGSITYEAAIAASALTLVLALLATLRHRSPARATQRQRTAPAAS